MQDEQTIDAQYQPSVLSHRLIINGHISSQKRNSVFPISLSILLWLTKGGVANKRGPHVIKVYFAQDRNLVEDGAILSSAFYLHHQINMACLSKRCDQAVCFYSTTEHLTRIKMLSSSTNLYHVVIPKND